MNDINMVMKDITDSLEESLLATDEAVYSNLSLIDSIVNKIEFTSGSNQYLYTTVADGTDTTFVVNGMSIVKDSEILAFDLTDETLEDAAPKVGIKSALLTAVGQVVAKKAETAFVDALRNDIALDFSATPDLSGIIAAITDMGVSVYTTEGVIKVGLPLGRGLSLASSSAFHYFSQHLNGKVQVVICEDLAETEMVVMHTHGVAGGYKTKSLEFDREGMRNSTAVISAYNFGYNWDSKYIRFIK